MKSLIVGMAAAIVVLVGLYTHEITRDPMEQWEVTREDVGRACIEYTKGGTKITTYIWYNNDESAEICHGELVEARKKSEIRRP